MHGASWANVFQLIPTEKYDKLVMTTHNNTEIHIQGILYSTREFLIVRGRLAASTDAGRVFFIPFDQVHYLAFREPISEADTYALLGLQPSQSNAPRAPTNSTADTGVESSASAPTAESDVRASGVSAKAALLERLRRARAIDNGAHAG